MARSFFLRASKFKPNPPDKGPEAIQPQGYLRDENKKLHAEKVDSWEV